MIDVAQVCARDADSGRRILSLECFVRLRVVTEPTEAEVRQQGVAEGVGHARSQAVIVRDELPAKPPRPNPTLPTEP